MSEWRYRVSVQFDSSLFGSDEKDYTEVGDKSHTGRKISEVNFVASVGGKEEKILARVFQ